MAEVEFESTHLGIKHHSHSHTRPHLLHVSQLPHLPVHVLLRCSSVGHRDVLFTVMTKSFDHRVIVCFLFDMFEIRSG